MAGQIPEARSLQSWEDAFQHPLPVVRRLEAQLRRNIDDNRSKLRVLVGASYRDLLGTAERIIEMDEQMQRVEGLLGDIGEKSNGRVVERIAENCGRMKKRGKGNGMMDVERGVLAQTKILKSCLVAAGRILKARGDALQAAKLFVLSRLLHKSVAESLYPPAVMGDLRRRLHSLRSKLLSYIEHDMARLSTHTTQLPHTICAYVLVASSTPKDALRHFLQVRYDQLDRKVDSPSEAEVMESLALYGQTLIDTRELFPRKVADMLGYISKGALLQNEQVISLVELNLDIYGSWIPEDIRTFTPWVRHDQLVSSEVADALSAWSQQARACLLERLGDYLKNQTDASVILESRQKFISRLLDLSVRVKNVTSMHGIEQVRSAFLERLSELAEDAARVRDLMQGASQVSGRPESAKSGSDIWSLASEDFDLSNGGIKLRRSILAARHGRNDDMVTEITKLDEWAKRVNDYLNIAETMSSIKWEDDLDFDSEFSGGESLQHELGKTDPEKLRDRLRQALQASLKDITQRIQAAGDSTENPAFYIRLWREVDLRRRKLDDRLSMSVEQVSLTGLYRNVASMVLKDVVSDFVQSVGESSATAVALWDGSPPLPVQCSPQTFRFMTRLHQSMASWGADLWTAQCVGELKVALVEMLGDKLKSEAFVHPVSVVEEEASQEEILTNGHSEGENKASSDGGGERSEDESNGDKGENKASIDSDGERSENDSDGDKGERKEKDSNGDEAERNGKEPSGNDNPLIKASSPEMRREQVVQNLFDTQYLGQVLRSSGRSSSNAASLDEVIRALRENGHMDDAGHERVKKSAAEFWKKTYLLFGLLAPAREVDAAA